MFTFAFEMVTLRFKTNINCTSCVRMVRPLLDELIGVEAWEVDTEAPEKWLEISGKSISAQEIQRALSEFGFEAESAA